MSLSFRTYVGRTLLSFCLGLGAVFSAKASLETAGTLLVNFDASALTPGSTVTTLDAVRSFTASGSPTVNTYTTNSVTVTALTFDGVNDYLVSSAAGSRRRRLPPDPSTYGPIKGLTSLAHA